MTPADFQKIVAGGEGDRVEFKLGNGSPEEIAKVACAFLNHRGGRIILGVGNAGQLVGVKNAEHITRQLESRLGPLITPVALWTVENLKVNGKDFVVVNVPEGPDKPYVAGGAIYYSRRGERVVAATRDEISDLIRKRLESSQRWERQIVVTTDLEDLDSKLIQETAQMASNAERWKGDSSDTIAFLHSLGLMENGGITNAALVLFGKHPTQWLPQARVRLLVMPEGKTGDRYEVDKVFESNLLRIVDQLPEALAVNVGGVQSRFSETQWQREDRPLYPMSALREGIMNALIHRDYSRSGSIIVSIMPDSLKISNPGGLPAELKLSDLKRDHPSVPRNPAMAHVCYLRRLIENIGRGTQRIVEDCRRARLREPRWESSPLETSLTFFAPAGLPFRGQLEELNERQRKILAALESRDYLKSGDVPKLLGSKITDRTIRSDLQILVDQGMVLRRGRGRSTTYELARKRQTS